MAWNWIVYDRPDSSVGRGASGRFIGRLAIPIGDGWQAGAAVGSWIRNEYLQGYLSTALTGRQEAVVQQLFLQRGLPAMRPAPFARLGIGLASTQSLVPAGAFVDVYSHWRPTVSVGGGAEVPLGLPLWLTVSVEYSRLFGSDAAVNEIRSGLAFGLGLTVR